MQELLAVHAQREYYILYVKISIGTARVRRWKPNELELTIA